MVVARILSEKNHIELIPVDIYIGAKAPARQESNWINVPAGKGWFPWFRFYGPEMD
jgi:hypothetical protein